MKNRIENRAQGFLALTSHMNLVGPSCRSAWRRSSPRMLSGQRAALPAWPPYAAIVVGLFALALFTGCASTDVTNRASYVSGGEMLPRPNTIWVYDFASTPEEIPAGSALAGQDVKPATPPTEEQIQAGREAGAELAVQLAADINEMGMHAERALVGTKPQVNDIVIRGYLLSVDEGSAAKRMTIGFGAGGSALKVAVEGYEVTAKGQRKLGSGDVQAGGSKTPGAAVGAVAFLATANPVGLIVSGGSKIYGEASGSSKVEGRAKQIAKEIAEQIQIRFKEQGWIQ